MERILKKVVNNEIGNMLPGAPPGSPMNIVEGKLIYEIDNMFEVKSGVDYSYFNFR